MNFRRAIAAFLAIPLCLLPLLLLTPSPSQAASAGAPSEGIPHFKHVVVLVEENENAEATFSQPSPFPYLADVLTKKGVFLPNYYATGHASLDNYLSMVSGQPETPLTGADCLGLSLWTCAQQTNVLSGGRNLADQLEEAGLPWRQYSDGAPTACFHAGYTAGDTTPDGYQGASQTPPAKDYADRHNPWLYFTNIVGNQARCEAHVRPYTDLAQDLAAGTLPAFSFITPDTCHDGHDGTCSNGKPGGFTSANLWLAKEAPALIDYLANNDGLLVVTFDENGFTGSSGVGGCPLPGCPSAGAGGRVGMVLVSPRLPQGATVTTPYDHHGFLRTLEDSFGLSEHLNLAQGATPMTAAFAGTKPASTWAGSGNIISTSSQTTPTTAQQPRATVTEPATVLAATGAPVAPTLAAAGLLGLCLALRRRALNRAG